MAQSAKRKTRNRKRPEESGRFCFASSEFDEFSCGGGKPKKPRHYKSNKLHCVDALDVAGFGSVDANLITFVDEGRNVDD